MFNENLRVADSEESVIIERIRLSYIKNRGDLSLVQQDTKCPREYIIKNIKKFKKESKIGVTNFVAEHLMSFLLEGYKTRTQYLFETLKDAEREEKSLRSTCCQSKVRQLNVNDVGIEGIAVFECFSCHKRTDTYQYLDDKYTWIKMDCIKKLREEDCQLNDFLEQNGYIGEKAIPKEETSNVTINNDNKTIIVQGISKEDVEEINKINPLQREHIRLALEKKIMEAEVIDG
jgi:hypothetical protein